MSTDSSELTFVRCPSCRSLVPASSSRCKMCGAGLDANASADQAEEERKRTARVRQNTTTQSSAEYGGLQASHESQVGEEETEDPFDIFGEDEASVDESQNADSAVEDLENPLGRYLPEEGDDQRKNGKTQPGAGNEPRKSVPSTSPHMRGRSPIADAAPTVEPRRQAPRPRDPEVAKPRVAVESGARSPGKPSSLSFGKPKQEERKPQAALQGQQYSDREERRTETQKYEQPKQNVELGKLLGWLVSFERSEGVGIELREGRFFISGSQLKPNDLVIPNKGLSTPHAMISVSASSGLRVQDLMSEGGLYIRKKGSSKYEKEESTVVLEHGDWVKFGDVEYLLALITNAKP